MPTLKQSFLNTDPSGKLTYFYTDAIAIYQGKDASGNWTGQPSDPQNSLDQVLKSVLKELLYINYNLPYQWAANIADPIWIARMTDWLLHQFGLGYEAVLFDDVNFGTIVNGQTVIPLVNSSGTYSVPVINNAPVTATAQWFQLMSDYLKTVENEVTSIFKDVKFIHNTYWRDPGFDSGLSTGHAYMKEQGFMDPGITGGSGYFSLQELLNWMDMIHTKEKSILIMEYDGSNQMYSLACSLLMTDGTDSWEGRGFTLDPQAQSILDYDFSAPKGPRFKSDTLWFRFFDKGAVIVNEPGAPTVQIWGNSLPPKSALIQTLV